MEGQLNKGGDALGNKGDIKSLKWWYDIVGQPSQLVQSDTLLTLKDGKGMCKSHPANEQAMQQMRGYCKRVCE